MRLSSRQPHWQAQVEPGHTHLAAMRRVVVRRACGHQGEQAFRSSTRATRELRHQAQLGREKRSRAGFRWSRCGGPGAPVVDGREVLEPRAQGQAPALSHGLHRRGVRQQRLSASQSCAVLGQGRSAAFGGVGWIELLDGLDAGQGQGEQAAAVSSP